MRPGVEVISRAQPLPRSAPTDTGAAFMVGATSTGDPFKLVRSMTEYEEEFGARTGGQDAYDAAEAYFREGGAKLTVSRTALTTELEAVVYDDSYSLADLQAAASARGLSTSGTKADLIERLNAAPLVVDPAVQAALDRLGKDQGPGQVFFAGAIGELADNQVALLAHCVAANRVAIISPADGDAASLTAAAAALRANANARYGAMFAPKAVIPGLTAGTTRTVPYAAIVAGNIARNDARLNPNIAAAGDLGQSVYATDLTTRYTDTEYEDLNEAGVDMARLVYGGVRTYGYRSLVDPASPAGVWRDFGHARLNMAIVAQAEAIGEHYVFTQIDGRRRTIASFGSDLRAMLVPFYEQGALYGETADEAFDVNVGAAVNTEETIANGELHAVLQVRMSPFAEWVVIEIVKVATTQAIAA